MNGMSNARAGMAYRGVQMIEINSVLPQTSLETQLSRWHRQIDPNHDFSERLAAQSTSWAHEDWDGIESMSRRSAGIRSSLPIHVRSDMSASSSALSTTATDAIPRLTHGTSLASSIGSADTSAASALDGGYVLSIQEDGVLTLPERMVPNADLLCPFQILDCDAEFSDVVEFKTHVFAHFRGQPAPLTAACFLCDDTFEQTDLDHPALAWNRMLSHLVHQHYRVGQRLATIRTNFSLMRWMYSRRMISDAQFKRTQLCPLPTVLPNPADGSHMLFNTPFAPMPPSAPLPGAMRASGMGSVGEQDEPFTVQAGRRAERRRRDATRVMHGRVNL
jgi:hypothetical protein